MLYVTNTPNNTGVSIHGDYMDFNEIYGALIKILGSKEDFPHYETVKIRVLAICYDLRHAMAGEREVEIVENGMDQSKMKRLSRITPDKNVYLVITTLWPEILFMQMALNDLIYLNNKKCKHPNWDRTTITVRKFQAAISECLRQTISETSYKRLINIMDKDYPTLEDYVIQYLDLLNSRFLSLNAEKRLKNIPIMARRIAEQAEVYQEVKTDVLNAARAHNCLPAEISLGLEFPEHVEW